MATVSRPSSQRNPAGLDSTANEILSEIPERGSASVVLSHLAFQGTPVVAGAEREFD